MYYKGGKSINQLMKYMVFFPIIRFRWDTRNIRVIENRVLEYNPLYLHSQNRKGFYVQQILLFEDF